MPVPATHLHRGTPEYRRTSGALFVAGFMAFALLYVAQGTLPAVSRQFSVSPATASLTISGTTLPLAVVSANWMGRLTDRRGRRSVLYLGFAIMAMGALASLAVRLPIVLAGTAAMVFGFFGALGWSGEVGMVAVLLAVGLLATARMPAGPDRRESAHAS